MKQSPIRTSGSTSTRQPAPTPPVLSSAGFLVEGPLPGSGNISYSSVHAIQLGPGLANGVRGTLSINFTLSPTPSITARTACSSPRHGQGHRGPKPTQAAGAHDNSNVAKVFLDNVTHLNLTDEDDTEGMPQGDGFAGDGLTLYAEYRDFMNGDDWTPGDPKKKDVFVLNQVP